MKILVFQKPPPLPFCLVVLWIGLMFGPLAAQNQQDLRLRFQVALNGLPPDDGLSDLPPDERKHVQSTRRLYERGTAADQMSPQELAQLSYDLKANTIRSGAFLRALKGKLCAMGCLPDYTDCNQACPAAEDKTAWTIRCLLEYDVCLTQCIIR